MKKILFIILVLIACKQSIERPPLHVEYEWNTADTLEVQFINLCENYDSLSWEIWNLETFENYEDTFIYTFPEDRGYIVELRGWQFPKPKKFYRTIVFPK